MDDAERDDWPAGLREAHEQAMRRCGWSPLLMTLAVMWQPDEGGPTYRRVGGVWRLEPHPTSAAGDE